MTVYSVRKIVRESFWLLSICILIEILAGQILNSQEDLISIPILLAAVPVINGVGGNIGNTFLRHFVLYLDYKNQQVILEKGDNYDKVFPRPKSGLQLVYNPDQDIEVHFVSPNAPADAVGFKKGDIVKKINGIDVQNYDGIIAIRKLMREDAGTTYTFEIMRKNERMEKRLELRELF